MRVIHESVDWSKLAFEAAIDGRFDPMPTSLFRINLLVAAYMPEVEGQANTLLQAGGRVQDACNELSKAARKYPPPTGPAPTSEMTAARDACAALVTAAAEFNDQVGARLRALHVG